MMKIIKDALAEDMPEGDITTETMVPESLVQTATIVAKAPGIFYGTDIINTLFQNPIHHVINGQTITPNDTIVTLTSKSRDILKAERVMLNFLQHLSGIATKTAQFITALDDPTIQILDTRKTTPLLRNFERQAVVAGGGHNHRLNLSDMYLIKENHLAAFLKNASPDQLPDLFRKMKTIHPNKKIEIEIETLEQLTLFDLSEVDIIMLDNFAIENIKKGVTICKEKNYKAQIEVSGNVSLENIAIYKNSGVHRISIGALTHSVTALDMSLRIHS